MYRLEFSIEIAPVAAARPRVVNGHAFTPDKYTQFKRDFRLAAREHAPSERLKGPLKLELDFVVAPGVTLKEKKRPHPSVKPDLDNYVKAVLDSMQDFWEDDAQVCDLRARKFYSWADRKPLIRVRLEGGLIWKIHGIAIQRFTR